MVGPAQQASAVADASAPEREIDARVYRLYAVTPGEIKLEDETGR